jgi:hypothetical protein
MDAPAASSRRRRDGTTLVVISVFLQVLEARNKNAESKETQSHEINTAATGVATVGQYNRGRSQLGCKTRVNASESGPAAV